MNKFIIIIIIIINYYVSVAVSNAIRTSLGPRGMDKMVKLFIIPFIQQSYVKLYI